MKLYVIDVGISKQCIFFLYRNEDTTAPELNTDPLVQALTMDYLQKNDMIVVAPGHLSSVRTESSDISTMRSQCKAIIVDYSWKMIFAEDEEAFNSLLAEMKTKVVSLGYNKVYQMDLSNAKRMEEERRKAVEKYGLYSTGSGMESGQ